MTGDPAEAPSQTSAATTDQAFDEQAAVPAVGPVLEELDTLDELPVEEHPAVYERAHDRLHAALADADEST